ncbi:MAG: hypothetical protein HC844_08325 [Tabrizicola sp.]|nr:hypothetical protein [Tabrizicola sp.]
MAFHPHHTCDRKADATTQQGLFIGTRVMTLEGDLPVEFLNPGDRIVTRSGARRLAALGVTELTNAAMMRISASAFGEDRPTGDRFIAPGQPILVRDWRAKAMFGTPTAVVPAARLADGEWISQETLPTARLFTLHFEDDEVIYAEGLELACAPLAA